MTSCRSRKTGNCSDYSKNKLLQEKSPGTFRESFPIPGSPASCVGREGCGQYHSSRTVPVWQRRGKPVFGLCMRLPGRDGTEGGRALNGIVYPCRSSKAGGYCSWVFPAVNCAVCL